MHRFYLPPERCAGPELVLTGTEAHHAEHVLRVRRGEEVVVLSGAGGVYHCEVAEVQRDAVRLHVREHTQAPPRRHLLTLFQALPKGKIIESIIQKATELGVSRIVPVLSERVVAKIEPTDAPTKRKKWQEIAIEAIKQCRAPWLPKVDAPAKLSDVLALGEAFDLALVGALRGEARHPREHFDAFRGRHGRTPATVAAWVGPEGDFTPAELDAIETSGALPITLGPLVLRSETAAIYCLSIINYEIQSSDAP